MTYTVTDMGVIVTCMMTNKWGNSDKYNEKWAA